MGAITKAFVDFIAGDPEIAELTAQFGFTSLSSPAGFVASMDALAVVVVCLYVVLGIHHLGEDELADRLDLVYSAPVSRTSWLTGGTVATGATAMVAMLAIGLGTWLGVALTGVDFGLDESMAAILNCLPLVVLTLGWAVAVHGVRPGWVVPVGGGAVVVLYLLSFLGPAVNAPEWLIDVSPWAHVAGRPARSGELGGNRGDGPDRYRPRRRRVRRVRPSGPPVRGDIPPAPEGIAPARTSRRSVAGR